MLVHVICYIADFLFFSEAHHASLACWTVRNCPRIQSRLTTRTYAEKVEPTARENARLLDELIATERETERQIRRTRRRARRPTIEPGDSGESSSEVYSVGFSIDSDGHLHPYSERYEAAREEEAYQRILERGRLELLRLYHEGRL